MNEALNIAAGFLDALAGTAEDWSPAPSAQPLFRRSSYLWQGDLTGYPESLAQLTQTPSSILLGGTLDNVVNWEPILDSALARSTNRLALITTVFDQPGQPAQFKYAELVDHFLGLWRLEFICRGGGHLFLISKVVRPTPRCFRKFPFFRRPGSDLAMPQPS